MTWQFRRQTGHYFVLRLDSVGYWRRNAKQSVTYVSGPDTPGPLALPSTISVLLLKADPRLDTLFLANADLVARNVAIVRWRLHRLLDSKKVVEVYDYVDSSIPMLARVFQKRLRGYRALGYTIPEAEIASSPADHAKPDDRADW